MLRFESSQLPYTAVHITLSYPLGPISHARYLDSSWNSVGAEKVGVVNISSGAFRRRRVVRYWHPLGRRAIELRKPPQGGFIRYVSPVSEQLSREPRERATPASHSPPRGRRRKNGRQRQPRRAGSVENCSGHVPQSTLRRVQHFTVEIYFMLFSLNASKATIFQLSLCCACVRPISKIRYITYVTRYHHPPWPSPCFLAFVEDEGYL